MISRNRFADAHTIPDLFSAYNDRIRSGNNFAFRSQVVLDRLIQAVMTKIGVSTQSRERMRAIFGRLKESDRIEFEQAEREVFLTRIHNLGVTELQLDNMEQIVDVGSGHGAFAGHALHIGLKPKIISVDPHADEYTGYRDQLTPEERRIIDNLTFKKHLEDPGIPKKFADLVIAHNLHFTHTGCYEAPNTSRIIDGVANMRNNARRALEPTFRAMVELLKDDGQVRIYPFNPSTDELVLNGLEPLEKDGYKIEFQEVIPVDQGKNTNSHDHHHENSKSFRILVQK